MTVHNTAFVLLISLLTTSGLLLCATNQVRDEEELRRGVGIHLGITHSSVAVFKHQPPGTSFYDKWGRLSSELLNSDKFEVVLNEQGRRTTPSCVAFTDSGVLIGQPAKDQAPLNSERTICGITPLIGNRFDDPEVQSYIKNLPYKVVNKENKPHIQVKFNNGVTKVYSPEEICAMILGKLKDIAEAYMGNKIEYATVVVHYIVGSFEKERKERNLDPSIKEAGKIVGLLVGITTSSRAASILAHQFSNPTNVLVYNLGGSAFDVSLQVRDTIDDFFDIVASRGDSQLGGQTFDMRVVEHFINLIKSKYQRDITNDIKALGKLRIECEKAKISLSSTDRVMIKIESLADGIMLFEEPLTRETFEELNMDLFNKTIDLVRSVVDQGGGIEKRNIDELVLVGGNARIPKIQQMLKEEFGVEPLKDVNPDEALAFVATRVVGAYSGKQFDFRHFGLRKLESLSVGIETLGGIMTQYVPGGGYVRLSASRNVTTYRDGQTTIVINIFEGERPLTKHCHYLGWLHISDLPPLPRGTPIIKVTVEVDLRWDIVVTAEHEESQQIKSVTIQGAQRYKTEKKIDQARSEFWDYYTEDGGAIRMEKTEVEGAIRMLMPQAYSTKFAVVNADDIIIYKYID